MDASTLYIAENKAGVYVVGITADVGKRLATLNRWAVDEEHKLLKSFKFHNWRELQLCANFIYKHREWIPVLLRSNKFPQGLKHLATILTPSPLTRPHI